MTREYSYLMRHAANSAATLRLPESHFGAVRCGCAIYGLSPFNTDPAEDYRVHRGDRIAQLVVQRVEEVIWQPVEELAGVDRGGGFGHSGR